MSENGNVKKSALLSKWKKRKKTGIVTTIKPRLDNQTLKPTKNQQRLFFLQQLAIAKHTTQYLKLKQSG